VNANDKNTCHSKDQSDTDEHNRQAIEQELQHYEDDGLSHITSPVEFWEVGTAHFVAKKVLY